MNSVHYSPFAGFSLLPHLCNRQEAEENAAQKSSSWSPQVDIRANSDKILFSVDLPGVPADQVAVKVEEGRLTISGERPAVKTEKLDKQLRAESFRGHFERTFQLPDGVDVEKIAASHKDGVLEIEMARSDITKPRTIEVKKLN